MSDGNYASHLFEQALLALDGLRQLGLSPSVENYAVWLCHVRGRNRKLSQRIREACRKGEEISQLLMDELYERFIARHEQDLMEHSQHAGNLLAALLADIEIARTSTGDYGSTLDEAVEELGNVRRQADVLAVTRNLQGATVRMKEQTSNLREELDRREQEVSRLRAALEEARMASRTDPRTGIGNRGLFDERLLSLMEEARMEGHPLSLLLLDIDHFKSFNDTHGHQIGDIVIRLVAAKLKEMVKGRDLPARYGGEEFAVILPQTECEGARKLAELIREVLANSKIRLKSKAQTLGTITASFGISGLRDGDTAELLIQRADEALYAAKKRGRNRVVTESDMLADA